jgi:hypothetical protein
MIVAGSRMEEGRGLVLGEAGAMGNRRIIQKAGVRRGHCGLGFLVI